MARTLQNANEMKIPMRQPKLHGGYENETFAFLEYSTSLFEISIAGIHRKRNKEEQEESCWGE
jgi:hypothetical protein